jgi:hypothetical protein
MAPDLPSSDLHNVRGLIDLKNENKTSVGHVSIVSFVVEGIKFEFD